MTGEEELYKGHYILFNVMNKIGSMFLLITLLLRSLAHFATNDVEPLSTLGDIRTMAADNNENTVTDYALKEQYLDYMTVIEGDTPEDEIQLRQIQDIEDDMQSIDDKEYWDNREREEREDPEGTFWTRSQLEDYQTEMEHSYRNGEARDRQLRRDEQERGRFPGTKEELQRLSMRDALKENLITGRRQRLQEWYPQRLASTPKAPPAGLPQPSQRRSYAIQEMTVQELRAKVRAEEQRIEAHQGGAYVTQPIPNLQQYKDRIEELEELAQEEEEDRRNRLQAEERR
eukprot:2057554-Amphidinium_carterae.1